MTFFRKKFPFSRQKFLMTFFLIIDQVFRIFPLFSQIFRFFTMLNVACDPFLTRKTPFLLCSYFHAHSTTLLLKILRRRLHGPSPTSTFGGTAPIPLGLRPCLCLNDETGSLSCRRLVK